MPEPPNNFASMTRNEQLAWFIAAYPQTSRLDIEFMLAVERGEWRPDLGTEATLPNYDEDGSVVPESRVLRASTAEGGRPAETGRRLRAALRPFVAVMMSTGARAPVDEAGPEA